MDVISWSTLRDIKSRSPEAIAPANLILEETKCRGDGTGAFCSLVWEITLRKIPPSHLLPRVKSDTSEIQGVCWIFICSSLHQVLVFSFIFLWHIIDFLHIYDMLCFTVMICLRCYIFPLWHCAIRSERKTIIKWECLDHSQGPLFPWFAGA